MGQDQGKSERDRYIEIENREWLESLEYILQDAGEERAADIIDKLRGYARRRGVDLKFSASTPYVNTISPEDEVEYPGDVEIERRLSAIIRWNAMAMVTRANKRDDGIGGHISTYASSSHLMEVAFNHFLRAHSKDARGDQIFFQGHGSPGIYARSFLEGRLSEDQLINFRRELQPEGGLSSYPHPWLMPDYWEFPTVSMGLAAIMAIYQARFNRYLHNRGLKDTSASRVWSFMGDGEMDEPESLGQLTRASREKLDNLIFVINCNLQRLDGPVYGNGKIIQELEGVFRGAGWRVIKCIWGSGWDELLAKDDQGLLVQRMGQVLDGDYQKFSVESGAFLREKFFGADPRLLEMVEDYSDDQLRDLGRGGHDLVKIYNAYKSATESDGRPVAILAKTVKGHGLGAAAAGKNIAHQQKKLNADQAREYRDALGMQDDIPDDKVAELPFLKPDEDSSIIQYLKERRQELGGPLPRREVDCPTLEAPGDDFIKPFAEGTKDREVSTTMAFVNVLRNLLNDKQLGKFVVPVVPDEARTFGMEALFSKFGIYSSVGQNYEPVDKGSLMYYKEAVDGQILEEGITEAGAMSSFIAAGTAFSTHGVPAIPFYIFYSMFGLQRIGDLAWAAGDMRCRGFLVGGTAGRTTLNGEGLQHEDGNSHLLAYPYPSLKCYDPAFAYELAVIVRDGIRRMYKEQEDVFYYLTVENDNYAMPPMPQEEGVEEGILKGVYRFRKSEKEPGEKGKKAHLLSAGAIMNSALKAAQVLEDDYGVSADVWSLTSCKELYRDGMAHERYNLLHPQQEHGVPYLTQAFSGQEGVAVASTDYVKAMPESISRWMPLPFHCLGTDGFGRSESREALREFFEVDYRWITLAALTLLAQEKTIEWDVVKKAIQDLEIDTDKDDPLNH
ncbi:MAG TPA: pyruvate dehydrogenase (acetyl-transferring), homodimeric type [Acidobacteriota bacterium]|nr:pyruvate dehydrogenase (acetyl-transferring), homodimeric type [Acidobacteriota bacterium]